MNHKSVMLSECLDWMNLSERSVIIDATLGLGGHSKAMLDSVEFTGNIIGLDQDSSHLEFAKKRLVSYGDRFSTRHMNFRGIKELVVSERISYDGILFDLGVASPHLDNAERGFSFQQDGPLDMRMNASDKLTAAEIINTWSYEDMKRIFQEYGEDPKAHFIANDIIAKRDKKPFTTTKELSDLICEEYDKGKPQKSKKHPATRVFQALRIAVNQELQVLEEALQATLDTISPGGRIVVMSYHSLEDRMVKSFFRKVADPCTCDRRLPICQCGLAPQLQILTRKAIAPSDKEIEENPRARSAKLRVATKI
ncbi:MAG: 16S rRNA (cytosine(1402)-N(4))-methyltransferase RsmH [Candidatus Gracilibacteria bacterium]|nr:16S rRNA (cytosine(1402)-N(4))-methyltransferase RsmH [Candidatus Gracilibacteria bacterium]